MKDGTGSFLLSIGEAAKLIGVCENTLRDWDEQGKLSATRTDGNHRRYTLEQVRGWLEEHNRPEKVAAKKVAYGVDLTDLVERWSNKGELDSFADDEKEAAAIIFENVRLQYSQGIIGYLLTPEQALYIATNGWRQVRFRKMVNIQPMLGPTGLVYCDKAGAVAQEAVVARAELLSFYLMGKADFDEVKKAYAVSFANEIDHQIFRRLPNCDIEAIVDASVKTGFKIKEKYDYIIGPEELIRFLREKDSAEGVDLYDITSTICADSFKAKASAGRYPQSKLDGPIYSPYVILSESGTGATGNVQVVTRAGWLNEAM